MYPHPAKDSTIQFKSHRILPPNALIPIAIKPLSRLKPLFAPPHFSASRARARRINRERGRKRRNGRREMENFLRLGAMRHCEPQRLDKQNPSTSGLKCWGGKYRSFCPFGGWDKLGRVKINGCRVATVMYRSVVAKFVYLSLLYTFQLDFICLWKLYAIPLKIDFLF